MEPSSSSSSSTSSESKKREEKVEEWEDFEQALARLWSLSSALNQANLRKLSLQDQLQSHLQVEAETLNRSNELDEMREQLESRKLMMGNTSMQSKVVKEKVKMQEEQLGAEIKSLLVAGSALSVASKHLQEANVSLAGERGCIRLKNLKKLLRLRQQYMVSQVSLIYPVKVMVGHTRDQELESFTSGSKSGDPSGLKPLDQGSLTISGLHLSLLPFTKMSFFTNKKEVQRSATALGYVAHAVSLLASYLEVPLRYSLRLGGSRSYIRDYAPFVEPTTAELASSLPSPINAKPIEFPLFLEGQDTTRAAYAVFLLNKDLEQLLNFIGVQSLGPRHVLANLRELLKTILSPEYIDT
ncbi:hypothetical protein DCAR_0101972 [Daucus carota subsp. sativus]|uniref:UV radiation resistance-associated gene protein n=1 Tax=Daucus carota subsp. sativus TaxID=79200 RepID=A0AAF0W482_DAUCS|nr:PREDICTED: UV radiation resistance-associated gene protein isoform X1 [Daucus carota subsp. sativus]WOG82804.1 hypothetical protein DCAR_0101972 [Daucus carota subsp. sativus]